MVKIEEDKYWGLIPFIDKAKINTFFARSVLTQDVNGAVYADKDQNASAWYIVHDYGMTLLLGDGTNQQFNKGLLAYFKGIKKDQWAQVCSEDWYPFMSELVNASLCDQYSRVNFKFSKEKFGEIDKGIDYQAYDIRRTPISMIDTMKGLVVPSDFWKKEYYKKCISFTVYVDGQPASTAFASFIHDDNLEIGIETASWCRGKGFAKVACGALINYCIQNHLEPHWSCRYENIGSLNLAQKLGFEKIKIIPYYHIISAK